MIATDRICIISTEYLLTFLQVRTRSHPLLATATVAVPSRGKSGRGSEVDLYYFV